MKLKDVNEFLKDLVGLPLTHTTRAANMECLKFGTLFVEKNRENLNIGLFALHLQASWRFEGKSQIIVGSDDLYERADESDEYDENYDYYKFNANLRDIKLQKLIKKGELIIISAKANKYGSLKICFNKNIKLIVFPASTTKAYTEYWRILDFRNVYKKSKHLVSATDGFH
jgi:hypothetical protein